MINDISNCENCKNHSICKWIPEMTEAGSVAKETMKTHISPISPVRLYAKCNSFEQQKNMAFIPGQRG